MDPPSVCLGAEAKRMRSGVRANYRTRQVKRRAIAFGPIPHGAGWLTGGAMPLKRFARRA